MTYEEALEYIHSLHWKGKKTGLTKTKELLGLLAHPEEKLKFVHIAGTNGKGSTAAFLSTVFTEAGYKTGLFTSPFIERFNERMMINGLQIPDEKLAEYTETVKSAIDKMEEPPSEFEADTAIGFLYFAEEACDIVILETGLGGMYDSTNVIKNPELSVITAIDFDHMAILGNTMEEIAEAKAGIIKPGVPVVFYGENTAAEKVIREKCVKTGSDLYIPDFRKIIPGECTLLGQRFSYPPFGDIILPLPGLYQQKNAALAIEALKILVKRGWKLKENMIPESLSRVKWPVRFEVVKKNPYVIIDGSHNPQGMTVTMNTLKELRNGRKVTCVFGAMADKDVKSIASILMSDVDRVISTKPEYYRAMNEKDLFELLSEVKKEKQLSCELLCGGTVKESIEKAFAVVKNDKENADEEEIILIAGSLYLAGEARGLINTFFTN